MQKGKCSYWFPDMWWRRRNVKWCNKKVWKCKGAMLLRWRSNTNISYSIFFFCNFALLQLIFALLLLCFHHLPIFPIAILHFCIIALLKAKEQGHISPWKEQGLSEFILFQCETCAQWSSSSMINCSVKNKNVHTLILS